MSVFTLLEVSKIFLKDERTIRRWCEKGFIPGAYRTKGGHWRIRAKKIYFIKPRVDGFSRDRSGLSKAGKKLAKQSKRGALRAIFVAVDALLLEEQALAAVDYQNLAAAMWDTVDKPPDPEAHESIKKAAVALWARKALVMRRNTSEVTRASGLPRTTFIRHFSRYLTKDVEYRVAASVASLHSGQTRINNKNVKPSGWMKNGRPRNNVMLPLEWPATDFKRVNQTTLDAYNREEPPWTPRCQFDYDEIDRRLGWKEP